jgi:two-component system, chemotaxis family, sensor kinase CheA
VVSVFRGPDQGPVQIEMHFYFFALLAMLCMFANPMVNIAAAVTVAVHHLVVWLVIPTSVFNYDAAWWVVLVHALFVVLETVAAVYISREFFDNVIGLEKIVQARTATIREKQRDMRLILDNVEEGLITVDLDGSMSSECSKSIAQWFGAPVAGEKLATWLGKKDANFGEWFELALESVRDGMLPPEVTISQLPARLKDGEKTYAIHYQLITNADAVAGPPLEELRAEPRCADTAPDGSPEKMLVIIADITERLRQEVAERQQAELLQLFQHIMRDKPGFLQFLTEADGIVANLKGHQYDGLETAKRLIHTLKGNAAIFGMRHLSEICHVLESQIAEEGHVPGETAMAGLFEAWGQVRVDLGQLVGEHGRRLIEIDDADYEAILQAVLEGAPAQSVTRMIESWRLEPAGKRLARIEQQIMGLAERMGKSNVTVAIEPNELRFNAEHFAPFWSSFIHVLRNTVDHGIEDRDQRQQSGKPEAAKIKVCTAVEHENFVVTVEDDGPGVDWERLKAKAGELGVAASAIADPERLICLPGVSSKATVTELSGRGVGMAAVRDACESLGGTIEVRSERGRGTRIRFVFPKDREVYEGHRTGLTKNAARHPTPAYA